jgi:23S rRNA pseudoU1915 N3-methylase RlmH
MVIEMIATVNRQITKILLVHSAVFPYGEYETKLNNQNHKMSFSQTTFPHAMVKNYGTQVTANL